MCPFIICTATIDFFSQETVSQKFWFERKYVPKNILYGKLWKEFNYITPLKSTSFLSFFFNQKDMNLTDTKTFKRLLRVIDFMFSRRCNSIPLRVSTAQQQQHQKY